jgi:threonine-phosphate decarboxylase
VARDRGWNWRDILDLSGGLNPLGSAPGVLEAVRQALERVQRFPEAEPTRLVEALARRWQVGADQVLLGNGATELLHFTARLWQKETATLATPLAPEFHRAHPLANKVAWNEPQHWPKSGLHIFGQPNRAIGQTTAFERIRSYLLETNHPVIVDESFIEFTDSPSAIPLIGQRPNLFVLRSLSHFYALPGLRIGALVGDSVNLEALRRKREPWQVNVLAEVAALASLADLDYAARTREVVAEEREWMWQRLRKIPTITPVQTEASFVLIYLASGAADLCRWLLDQKVLVSNCTGWPGIEGEAVRIGLGTREVNDRVAALLRRYITGMA